MAKRPAPGPHAPGPHAPGRETLVPLPPLHASSTPSYFGLDHAIVTFQKEPLGWPSKATWSVACNTGACRRRSTCRAPAGPVALVPRLGLGAGSSVAGRCPRDVGEGHTRAAAMTVTQFPPPPSTPVCAVPASFTVPGGQPSSDPLQPGQSSCR